MSNPETYTVGWICAILPESVAAQEFLDEKDDPPASGQFHDDNNYTSGRIGEHKVVIATLPDGEYGTSSAARAGAKMLASFPNIRIGLMVGIGGGVPSEKNDIRLGDIVVSVPRDGKGGVVQHNFGKRIQGKKFKHTGFLNRPPTFLLTAVTTLKVQYKRKGHQIQQAIDAILDKNPRLRQEFQRPEQCTDRLFKAEVIYDDATRPIDEINLVHRRERTKYEDNPAIHYGTIASADELMKDATIRDELAKEWDVLCFEMEAAGLMNHFPCLVIRGICDYSDSHKNKEWQGYAAMAAAAYAKDILKTVSPDKVVAEQKLKDVVETIKQDVEKLQTTSEANQNEAMLDWLASNNHSLQQSRFREKRYRDIGFWFLASTEFRSWEKARGKTMLCEGVPGVGKTIMTSIVIDHLLSTRLDAKTGIAFLYLDYGKQQEQTTGNLLAGLLRQLASSGDAVDDSVKVLYNNRKKNPIPTREDLLNTLDRIIRKFETVFLIVDALDECQSSKCGKELMSVLLGLQSRFKVNIFATSRPNSKITEIFRESQPISKDIIASSEDIEKYLADQLLDIFSGLVNGHWDLLYEAKRDILQAADGIFLITHLYVNLLHDRDVSSPEELRNALRELRRNIGTPNLKRTGLLKSIYDTTLDRIHDRSEKLAIRTLLCVTCAKRQMTSGELQSALAIAMLEGNTVTNPRKLNVEPMERILSLCLGLVTIDPATDHVRLFHHTAYEYFTSTQEVLFPDADTEMTKICLTYLSNYTPDVDYYKRDIGTTSHPFYEYAASYWGHHARNTSECLDQIIEFLGHDDKVHLSSFALMASIQALLERHGMISEGTTTRLVRPLHLVAFFGLHEVFNCSRKPGQSQVPVPLFQMWKFKKQLSQKATVYAMSPLHFAVLGGHKRLVELLIKEGAEINIEDGQRRTPFALAVYHNHVEISKLLEKKGGKMMVDNTKETAWKWAMVAMATIPRFGL